MTRINTKREKQRYYVLQTVQWLCFSILIAGAFFMSTAGSYLKPLLLLPLALCISSRTGEIQAMAVGTVCGLLMDIAGGKLMGSNALLLVVFCVPVSLLYQYILRQKLLNILAITAVCTAVQGYLDYLFYYAIWGHTDVFWIYSHIIFPAGLMTVASVLVLYCLVGWIARCCGEEQNRRELEKTVLSTYRD